MLTRRDALKMTAGAGLALAAPASLQAQAAAISKPGRLILGFPPGGSTDVVSPLLLNHIKDYAPSLIVDNRPGAGGRIGVQAVKASPTDGATFGLSPASILVIYPHVYAKLHYDPLKDFEPVCTACSVGFGLVVGPMVPESVKSLQQFADWCAANPDKASYGSSGAGSMPHFAGEMVAGGAKFKMVHVPYRGAAPAVQDLVAGQIAANLAVITNVLPHIQSGKVRVLVTTGDKRSPFLPDTPTLAELGMKDLVAEEWFGIYMPAGTPRTLVSRLAASVRNAMNTSEVAASYKKLAMEPAYYAMDDFRAVMAKDLEKWGAIVRATGFKME